MKKCFKCNLEKELSDFYKHPKMGDGHLGKCKECTKADVRYNYSLRIEHYRDYDKYRQRRNIKRILSHRYNLLKARSDNNYAKTNGRYYKVTGMKYLTRKQFDKWADDNMAQFMSIYKKWQESGFNTSLMPSIDRIDSTKGYMPENMQWLSRSDNCKKYDK